MIFRRGSRAFAGLVFGIYLVFPALRIVAAELAAASPALGYASFVCWKYPQLPQLRAWKETERIIATTLTEAYPALQKGPRQENGSPDQLKDFLRKLPDGADQLTLVYLAAHQSPGGQWYFPDRSVVAWGSLMEELPNLKSPQRLVLLDCCYATSVNRWPGWSQKIAPACLFASPGNRPTPDLFVFWRRPVDWAVYFPGASHWLHQHHFDDSDEQISFFGLVWLEAWTKGTPHPQNLGEWNQLAQAMTQIAEHASTQIHSDDISGITSIFPP